MENTNGLTLRFTKHAREQMEAKGFKEDVLREDFSAATADDNKIYPNKKYPGQFRVIAGKACLTGKPTGNGVFLVFTMYEDGVLTPPRADQMNTPQGQAYAKRYAKAKASGRTRRENEYWPRVHKRNGDMSHTLIK